MQQKKITIKGKGAIFFSLMMTCFLIVCSKENVVIPLPPSFPPDTSLHPSKSYLALGDSYTIGQSVSAAERFPAKAVNSMHIGGIRLSPVKIIATTGWTTGNLLQALSANPPAQNYDLVTLLIGVNSQYQGRSQEEYRTEFSLLLNNAIGYAGGQKNRVFVLSIPDYSVTPFAQYADTVRISNEIDEFNTINRQISQQAGVHYLDITNISREGRTDPSMHASDGLHPSGRQYQRWADLLAPMMKISL